MTDLGDTTGCPLGVRCESCGIEGSGLAVKVCDLDRIGVACLTMCVRCAAARQAPPVAVSTAVRLVLQHCMHLGITSDDMVLILRGASIGRGRGLTSAGG